MRKFLSADFFPFQVGFGIGLVFVYSAVFGAPEEGTQLIAKATFSDVFLRQIPGQQIDVSRYNQGNIVEAGIYRADLYANQIWVGRIDIPLRPVNGNARNVQPCFDRDLLERVGVNLSKLTGEGAAHLNDTKAACAPLSAYIEDATASFDSAEQRVDVSVPQIFIARQARDFVDPQYWDEGVTAARLKYNANAYQSKSLGNTSTNGYLGVDTGLNFGPWRFNHRGNLTYDEMTGNKYQSVQSNLQRSIGSLRSQFVIGDAFTDGVMFDSVGFRGVQLASDDRMFPESQRGYAPTVRGIAQTNARVQVRQSGNIIYETTVAPGPFEINDLYPTGYGGDLDVVVTEANGTVRISRVPYAAAVNALRPGITRFSITGGNYRNPSVASTPLLVEGTLQHGLTNLLTSYGGGVLSENYSSAILGAALNTEYGAVSADITHATTKLANESTRQGQSLRLSYSKLLEPTNTNLTLAAYRYSSEGFLGLADAMRLQDVDKYSKDAAFTGIQRGKFQATINQSLAPGWGNVYLSGSTQNYWNQSGRDTQTQAGYNNYFKRVNYGVAVSRQLNLSTSNWDNQVLFTVSFPLGDSPRSPYSSTQFQRDSNGSSSIQQALTGTAGKDSQFAYGVNAGRTDDGKNSRDSSLGGNVSYVSPLTTLSASASKTSDYTQMSVGLAGGVVAFDGGVVLAPDLGETIAVVEAKDASGARLTNGTGLRVDRWGHAVVSNLTPFSRNRVEIDPLGLPIDVELKSTMQQTAPTAGAVVKLKFETQNAGRTAIFEIHGSSGKLLSFGTEVRDTSGQVVGTVGQGGRLLARGLLVDSGTLIAALGHGQCQLKYKLPPEIKSPTSITVTNATCNE